MVDGTANSAPHGMRRMTMMATTNEPILDAAKALTPSIAARAEEIERARRVPPDLVDELLDAGCFRMLVPRSHGGAQLDISLQIQVLEELARADASVAWTVMIGSEGPLLFRMLPRTSFDALYAAGPDVIIAGASKPTGVATPVEGGYRVNGQWAFASGCQHAHWFIGSCVVDDGREPPVRMMVLTPSDIEIKDTWSVSGMCGTGSHDVVVNGAFVSDELSFVFGSDPSVDVPPLRIPEVSRAAIQIASVTIGVARGALDEILALALDKTPTFAESPLASNPLFQNQFGEAESQLRAARAALRSEADIVSAKARASASFTPEDRAHVRGITTWVARTAAAVVNTAYQAGGMSSLYTSNPLQRRLRDAHALIQHFVVKADTFTKVGAVLAGQDVDLTLF
jgi:alkylation response protein AidB-like acyl-CoA dehydrogenase